MVVLPVLDVFVLNASHDIAHASHGLCAKAFSEPSSDEDSELPIALIRINRNDCSSSALNRFEPSIYR